MQLIDATACPCDGCQANPCGHPAKCQKFAVWLNKIVPALPLATDKRYDPKEAVTVTLETTKEKLHMFMRWIAACADEQKVKAYWWKTCCVGKVLGAETAAKHEANAKELEEIHNIIEAALFQ
jgi:hypothetical protein